MFQISRSQAQVVHRCGGIFDATIMADMPETMQIELPHNCGAEQMNRLLQFLEHGECHLSVLDGKCKNEIQFLGVENAFDDNFGFASSTWKFILALCELPELLVQHLRDKVDKRALWMNWAQASEAECSPFTSASLEATPYLPAVPAGSHLLPGLPRDTELSWEHMHRELARLPQGIPWAKFAGQAGVVLAGGSLESLLRQYKPNDFDLFIVMPGSQQPSEERNSAQARSIVLDTIHAIRKHHCKEVVYVSKNKPHVVDIIAFDEERSRIHYQVITRVYASLAQVVAGFDIDSCRLGYDGLTVRAHPTAFRAWKNKWNLFNATTLSNTALIRYYKKFDTGIGILLPGVESEYVMRVMEALVQIDNSVVVEYMRHDKLGHLEPTVDNMLLVFRVSAIPELQDLGRHMSDYGGYNMPPFRWFSPCTSMWIGEQHPVVPMPDSPCIAPLFTALPYRYEEEEGCFYVNFSFGVLTDNNRCFTGAFNPKECEIYIRNPWIHKGD